MTILLLISIIIAVIVRFHYSPLRDLNGGSIPLRSAAYLLGTDHPPGQKEHDDSGGKEDENEEDCDIREANAGGWGRGRSRQFGRTRTTLLVTSDCRAQTLIFHVRQQFYSP